MKYCIPDELFNRVPRPTTAESVMVGLDGIYREIAYKLPGAEVVEVRKEVWHSFVDFSARLGAFIERLGALGAQVQLTPTSGKFLRIVGAEAQPEDGAAFLDTVDFSVAPGDGGALYASFSPPTLHACAAWVSVRPPFDDTTQNADGEWNPRVPRYMIDRYGECIAHGALTRLYAMRGNGQMARMHATAYNNDLNRLSFGLITAGMRKHFLIDVEDWIVNTTEA